MATQGSAGDEPRRSDRAAQAKKVTIDSASLATNREMLRTFSRSMIPALGIILFLVAIITIFVLISILRSGQGDTRGQTLAIHLVQISVGIFLGILCLFLGAAMSWFGITGTFMIKAEGGGAKINMEGAQVGIILLVGGIVLTGLSLQKSASSQYETLPGIEAESNRQNQAIAALGGYIEKSQKANRDEIAADLARIQVKLEELRIDTGKANQAQINSAREKANEREIEANKSKNAEIDAAKKLAKAASEAPPSNGGYRGSVTTQGEP